MYSTPDDAIAMLGSSFDVTVETEYAHLESVFFPRDIDIRNQAENCGKVTKIAVENCNSCIQ